MRQIALILVLACLASQQAAVAGEPHVVRLKWADLGRMVEDQQVAVTTNAGVTIKGKVRTVEPDAIVLRKGKAPRIDRTAVAEVRMTRYVGNGRYIGRFAGGILGLVFGLIGAVAVGMREGSNRTGDKVLVGALGIGGLPAGALAGHYLGRLADKEVTVIRVIPE